MCGTEAQDFDEQLLHAGLFKAINFGNAVGLYCGSALKNKGIQPLIEGVLRYFPSPDALQSTARNVTDGSLVTMQTSKKDKLRALAFKVVNDKEKGMITFFRVYQGMLKSRQKLYNTTLGEVERVQSLMRVRADEMQLLE